jgi:hypothetical protein
MKVNKMNRDIRFRAWDIDMREMLEVSQITFAANCDKFKQPYLLDQHNDVHYLDEVELMQFTGLYDKNNKEIYEGDLYKGVGDLFIVRLGICPDTRIFSAYLENVKPDPFTYELKSRALNGEVIGNVFENPELLQE